MILVGFNWVLISLYREEKVIRYSQPMILYMFLSGLMLVSAGAVVYATNPSKTSCIIRQWLVTLGYSLELVPLIVKVAAINKLIQSASELKRVKITPYTLYKTIGGVVGIIVVFLIVCTVVDPPTRYEEQILTNEENLIGGVYVDISYSCASNSKNWMIITGAYITILLICATVLAFQSRNIRQDFNESSKLAFVVYAQFIFFLLRILIFFFSSYLVASVSAAMMSIILSFDVIATLFIYFAPKIVLARKPKESELDVAFSLRSKPQRSAENIYLNPGKEKIKKLKTSLDEVNELLVSIASTDLVSAQIDNICGKKDSVEGRTLSRKVEEIKKTLADMQALGKADT